MKAIHTRFMLRKIDFKKYNLALTFTELEELERLAQIGKATEKVFEHGYIVTYGIEHYAELYDITSIENLINEFNILESEGER